MLNNPNTQKPGGCWKTLCKPGMILAVILLVAVFVLVGCQQQDETTNPAIRGENWTYGTVIECGDNYFVLDDAYGGIWYVDTTGVEVPAFTVFDSENQVYESRWVYYNGDPEPAEGGYTGKIKPTMVLNGGIIDVRDFGGEVYDHIYYDLNGDGTQEHWVLCGRDYPEHKRLLAMQDGVIIYDVLLYVIAGDGKFHPQEDGIKVIGRGGFSFLTLDVRLIDGRIAVFHGEKQLEIVDRLQ